VNIFAAAMSFYSLKIMMARLNLFFAAGFLWLAAMNFSVSAAAETNSSPQIAFMKMTLPKTNIYAGEVIAADIQIYIRQDVQLADNPHIEGVAAEGFTVGKIPPGNGGRVQIGNAIYNVIPAKIALTAIKPGPLSIGPVTLGLVLDVPSENQPPATFGGLIIRIGGGERKQISIATETIKAEALPLPVENVPPDFNGAVGDYTLALAVGPTNVPAGDPVTLRVQISGRGALDNIRLPDLSAWPDWKVFPPTFKIETTDALGIEGAKTFEEIVTPQSPDIRALPQFSFSFFNPADRNYHTFTNPPVPLIVRADGATTVPTIATNKNSAPQNQAPQDISPIRDNLGALAAKSAPFIAQPAFIAAQTLPILAFITAFIWRKRTDSLANNPRLRRKIAVEKLIQNGIDDLRKFATGNKPEEFFALLFRLLQEQLGERLDYPATAITENVVEENSLLRGAPEIMRNDLRELFQLCNQARYAPVRGTSELNSVAAQFEKTAGELQNLKA
jgi:hypothetical protein